MAKTYHMVRVTTETWEQLKVLQAVFQTSNAEFLTQLPENEIYGVTLDTVIRELIERDWSHRLRAGRKKRPQTVREALGGPVREEPRIDFTANPGG